MAETEQFQELLSKVLGDAEATNLFEDAIAAKRLRETLSECRAGAELSQEQLAKQIGCAQAQISRYERGDYDPPMGFLRRYAQACGWDLKFQVTFR